MSFKRSVAAIATASMITIGLTTPSAQAQIPIPAEVQKQLDAAEATVVGSLMAPFVAPAMIVGSMNPAPQNPGGAMDPAMVAPTYLAIFLSFGIGLAFYAAVFAGLDSLLSS